MYASNITDLPTLYSYEQALKHYESIKPIRGSDNIRPICATQNGRRKKHMQIIKRDDAIACRLYATDVLTFYKDGVVEYNSGTYISNTTHSFANGILYPYVNFGTRLGNTEVWIKAQTYYVPPKQTFKMKREGDTWVAIDPPKNFEYYLKRKEYNAKRKPLKEFQDHCIRMAKLADPKEPQTVARIREVIHADRKPHRNCRLIYDAICAGDGGTTVAHMLNEIRDYTYSQQVTGSQYKTGWGYVYHFDLDQLKEIISDIVKYAFADELFEKIETVKRTFNGNNLYIKENKNENTNAR